MGTVKSITNSAKKTIKNPTRLAGTVLGSGFGLGGALLGNQAGKYVSEEIAPPDYSGLEGQQRLQGELVNQRLQAGEQFNRDLPAYVQEEYNAKKAPLEDQYKNSRTNLMASLSNRGMLSSGNALKQRANLEAGKAQAFGDLKASTVQDATQRAQAYRVDPLQSVANVNEQKTSFQSGLDDLKRQTDASRNALIGSAAGMIGQGVGQGLGNVNQGKKFGSSGRV